MPALRFMAQKRNYLKIRVGKMFRLNTPNVHHLVYIEFVIVSLQLM